MARENTIVLSDDELETLQRVRQKRFGSDEVPYGVVVDHLCEFWENKHD